MGGDDDDFDYTTEDLTPREPDRFEKRGEPSEKANDEKDRERKTRERG